MSRAARDRHALPASALAVPEKRKGPAGQLTDLEALRLPMQRRERLPQSVGIDHAALRRAAQALALLRRARHVSGVCAPLLSPTQHSPALLISEPQLPASLPSAQPSCLASMLTDSCGCAPSLSPLPKLSATSLLL